MIATTGGNAWKIILDHKSPPYLSPPNRDWNVLNASLGKTKLFSTTLQQAWKIVSIMLSVMMLEKQCWSICCSSLWSSIPGWLGDPNWNCYQWLIFLQCVLETSKTFPWKCIRYRRQGYIYLLDGKCTSSWGGMYISPLVLKTFGVKLQLNFAIWSWRLLCSVSLK